MIKFLSTLVIFLFPIISSAAEFKFIFHTFEPNRSSMYVNVFQKFVEEIEEESKGRIKIELYPSMTLGGRPHDLFWQAKDGVVDFAMVMINLTPGLFPKTEITELPLILSYAPGSSRAIHEFILENSIEEFDAVVPLAFGVSGPTIINIRTNVNSIAGKKLRVSSRHTSNLIRKQQGIPVGMPITDVSMSLARGIIDGVVTSWEGAGISMSYESAKHVIYMPKNKSISPSVFALVMNKNTFNNLPKDLQDIFLKKSGIELSEKIGIAQELGGERIKNIAISKGITTYTLSEKEYESWKNSAIKVQEEWIEQKEKSGITNARYLLNTFKEKVERHIKEK